MRDSRAAVESLVAGLGDDALSIAGGDGWSLADHLGHLACWAMSIVSLLREGHREGLGLKPGEWDRLYPGGGLDAINAAVLENVRKLPPPVARQAYSDAHNALEAEVELLGEAALTRTYRSFEPTGPEQPVVGWIIGDSYDHDADHMDGLRALVAAVPR